MTERTNYLAARTPSVADLRSFAVPIGEVAIERTLAFANDALLGCFPKHLQTHTLSDRFITRARVHPVPQHELGVRQRADKPSDRMAIFALVLEAGLPREQAEELTYFGGPTTRAYANIFLEQPELYVDEELYQGFFSSDRGDREHAACVLGTAAIDFNLAAVPRVRTLPRTPWQAVLRKSTEEQLLPSFRRLLEEAGTYDHDRFVTLVSSVGAFFIDEAAAVLLERERPTLALINAMMNTHFADDQEVEAVEWEPNPRRRLVAHGAKVLLQREDQVLPVFELGTGVSLDHDTREVFAREATLAFYSKLQQHGRLPVVARHELRVRGMMTPLPRAYLEIGASRASILEHYIQSDVPEWYRAHAHRPALREGATGSAWAYPS